jgi:endonuclease YncB( thermonuclease family)
MFRKLFYAVIVSCLTASFLLSQDTAKASAQTDKPKKTIVPADKTVNIFKLLEGKANTIYEGDTIDIKAKDGKTYLIKMLYIDAPEESQNYSVESKKKLSDLILGKDVTVVVRQMDSNDRYLGTVYFDEKDVNLSQIETGMAWHFRQPEYEQSADDQKLYAQAEQKARDKQRGLWKDKNPVSPWDFRSEKDAKEREERESQLPRVSNTPNSKPPETDLKTQSGRKYIRGPRGGCYYINSKGNKTYVDRSLCN